MKETTKQTLNTLFTGEVTWKKKDLWLLGAVCLLVGIVYGLKTAPLTHGFSVSCGNNNGNNNGKLSDDCCCDEECECECDCDCDEECDCDCDEECDCE